MQFVNVLMHFWHSDTSFSGLCLRPIPTTELQSQNLVQGIFSLLHHRALK